VTSPPSSVDELVERARALAGRTVAELARELGVAAPAGGRGTKGRVGELVERALGASGGGGARVHDFPDLGVELKTIPVDETGAPLESTFVCAVRLDEDVDFASSWVAAKLARVLFVPVVGRRTLPSPARAFASPVLWEPTAAQRSQLSADYDDIMGLIGAGRVEDVTAHLGRWLQLRPKARDGSARTVAFGAEGERIPTVPRGFYLRPTFTRALLEDPTATP
jgi:DNA mismatch repair protein MutH